MENGNGRMVTGVLSEGISSFSYLDKKTKSSGNQATKSMYRNIMFQLFDLSKLIIEDKDRLNLFKNEIGNIIRISEERVAKQIERATESVDFLFRSLVGEQLGIFTVKNGTKLDSLKADLKEFIEFVYGEDTIRSNGFLKRVYRIIETEFHLHFPDGAKKID